MAGTEPAGHPGHAGSQRRQAMARVAQEDARLDPVHRRAAHRPRVRRLHACRNPCRGAQPHGAQLPRHIHGRPQVRAAHLCQHAERLDEAPRAALHGGWRLPHLRGQATQTRCLGRDVRGFRHRRAVTIALAGAGPGARARRQWRPPRDAGKRCQPRVIATAVSPALSRACGPRRQGPCSSAGCATHTERVRRKADRGPAHGAGHAQPNSRADRARARLPLARPQHANTLFGRVAAPSPGHPDCIPPVRGDLCA